MNVVISFVNATWSADDERAMPCFYESFIREMRNLGHDLLVFHAPNDSLAPQTVADLKRRVLKFSPDLVIAFNNFGPDYASFCDCPILVYEVDSVLYYYGQDWIRRNPNRYFYCVAQQECRTILLEKYAVEERRVVEVPFFTSVQAESCEKLFNISFVGSRFAGRRFPWYDFMRGNPTRAQISSYQRLLDELRDNPFRSSGEWMAEYPDLELNAKTIHALIFGLSAEKRVQVLSSVATLGLRIFGTSQWLQGGGECAELYLAYDRTPVYSLRHNQDLYNESRVCLNVNHLQAVSAFSWRVCDIMASTGCLCTEYRPNLERCFPGLNIPTFTNKIDAYAQCKRLLESEALRKDISMASRQAIDRGHRFIHVARRLDEAFDLGLVAEPGRGGAVTFIRSKQRRQSRTGAVLYAFKLLFSLLPTVGKKSKISDYLDRIESCVWNRG